MHTVSVPAERDAILHCRIGRQLRNREGTDMGTNRDWIAPLTGLAFVVLVIIAFAIGGEPPDPTDNSVEEVVDFWVDNDSAQMFSAALAAVAGTLFVFFGGYLRKVLRNAEGPGGGLLSAVAFAGVIIFALGIAIDSTIAFALADSAEDIEPDAVQALSVLYNNDFVPFALGIQVFLLATGISVVRHGALPKWIGWVAIVLAVIAVTPIGFVAFIVTGILVAVMSVMLTMRARAATA
jgi:hypothetical protein